MMGAKAYDSVHEAIWIGGRRDETVYNCGQGCIIVSYFDREKSNTVHA